MQIFGSKLFVKLEIKKKRAGDKRNPNNKDMLQFIDRAPIDNSPADGFALVKDVIIIIIIIQNTNKTRQSVETVNFRLYFKVIIRQNETQYFTYIICSEQESENTASPEARDYLKLLSYIYMMEILYMQLIQLRFSFQKRKL